ncbi:YfcC family protein [Flagellimonas meridianipacifica]|uniref:Putative ion transporter superfamily protein YfcC n=1 Tax=Flagellimonas meridianipacifica TaxID=1080225 RepID=A0A2T0MBG1_9FLAO|nr:TIGR00366 family protein [Allomuricauda pacifica]PRX54840.1 putative ion transporter superfamily protein YfcC [Allomuricauda pacifica]
MNTSHSGTPSFLSRIPHAITMLFGIIVLVSILTYILPAGTYERILVDGSSTVVPDSYRTIESTPVGLLDMFKAIPLGFKAAVEIIFIVLAGGIMFGFMEKSKAVENAVGTLVNRLGLKKKNLIIIIMTFIYGILGVAVGYENNIAMVPIAAVLSLALGGDLILAAGISVGAMTIGFGLSPINPYTVGTGHKIAELPMFSGALLRSVLCFSALSLMAYYNIRYFKKISLDPSRSLGQGLDVSELALSKPVNEYSLNRKNWMVISIFVLGLIAILYGVFNLHWYINELSAVFLMIALLSGLVSKMSATEMSETVLKAVGVAAPGAFMVGFATSIKVLMEMGNIGDTISYQLSVLLEDLPLYASAICMSISQTTINFFIPSGSGQALATLPVMLPLGESLGLTRQITILAFQIGDGLSNLVNPTLGGLIAMLSMCRVPIDRWIRFIFPVLIILLCIAFLALIVAVATNYS